jgi:hypothetical protein
LLDCQGIRNYQLGRLLELDPVFAE